MPLLLPVSSATAVLHTAVLGLEAVLLLLLLLAVRRAVSRQARLSAGELQVRDRLEHAERIRSDLIATVSHEFRTPLTGIRGSALTLRKRGHRLDDATRARLLEGVLEQTARLSHLLENMLTAAEAVEPTRGATADVGAVAAEVTMLARTTTVREVQVLVEPGTEALIERGALHQVLANLVDNAHQHGRPDCVPILAGGSDPDGVWITVSNEVTPGQLCDDALFGPFVQADTSATRGVEGAGLGLYLVRRLVEVHGGTVSARSSSGWFAVEVHLPRSEAPSAPSGPTPDLVVDLTACDQTPVPTAEPTA